MTKYFRNLRQAKKAAAPPVPRPIETITEEYSKVSAAASQAQYQVYIYSEQLEGLNRRMKELNTEAGERNKLDGPPTPVTNTQEVANV
jgi:hypothetical protein